MMKEVALDIENPGGSQESKPGAPAAPGQPNGNGHGPPSATAAGTVLNGAGVNGSDRDRDTEIDIEINPHPHPHPPGMPRPRVPSTGGEETPPTRTASEEHPDPEAEDGVTEANPLTGGGSGSGTFVSCGSPSASATADMGTGGGRAGRTASCSTNPDHDPASTARLTDDEGLEKTTKSTIIQHQMYQQYCFCCPEFIANKSKLFITTCCVLSLFAGILISVAFFYPESVFGARSKLVHGGQSPNPHVIGGGGGMIHHPHQNRYILHSPTAKKTFPIVTSGHRETADPHHTHDRDRDYDDESLSAGSVYGHLGPILNSGRQSQSQSQSQSHLHFSSTSKDVINFSEHTQTHNYSNVIQSRLLHFDLKGAPPTVTYMKEIMKLGKEAGITGVLLEWEDTFPWKGRLFNTSLADGAGYSDEQVQEILDYAELELELEVIPLIQTFGHVEYILKSPEFFHLREDPNDPQSFCPSLPDTLEVVREMINQIADMHKNAKFIHIGCDEVFNIGLCPLCTTSRSGSRNSGGYDSVETLFLRHVKGVGEIVKAHGMIPIIWDDMLRSITVEKLIEFNLSYFEPMVWVYAEDIDKFVNAEHWEKYSRVFATVWVAGAFKGAFGETLTLPPLQRHAENTQNWIHVVSRESSNWDYGIGGIVLTGWSRYDHFSVLCELLPASIPSLMYTSLILSIPSTMDSSIIKNRVFIPSNLNITHISVDEEDTGTSILASRRRRRKKRSPAPAPAPFPEPAPIPGKKWVPHPQSLRINSMPISTFSGSTHDSTHDGPRNIWKSSQQTTNMIEKYLHINSEFIRILHCSNDRPIAEFELPALVRDEETAAGALSSSSSSASGGGGSSSSTSFISKCNFPGIQFYRSVLRLKALQDEIWALDASLTRSRGWVGPYNQRHNFSSAYRVGELIFKETPKYRRNLSQIAKVLANGLKRLFPGTTILEWIELNVWSAWEVLDKWERVGDDLKAAKTWKRRPLRSPDRLVRDLGLGALQLLQGGDLSGRDEL